MNRQIGVGDSKNVIVFDPLLTGHVIRRMRSGRVRVPYWTSKVEHMSAFTAIFSNICTAHALSLITQERIGVGASNLAGIIDVGVDACGILSRSVGQINRK